MKNSMKMTFKAFFVCYVLILSLGLSCQRGDNTSEIMLYVDNTPIYIGEFYALIETKKDLWESHESGAGTDNEMRFFVLRELVISKILINYGERAGIMPDEETAAKAVSDIVGEIEYIDPSLLEELKKNYTADFILARALRDKITVKPEEVEEYLKNINTENKFLEPAMVFLMEFLFDNERDAQIFHDSLADLGELNQVLEHFNEYSLSNPNADMNVIGYIPHVEAVKIIGIEETEELKPDSFSGIREGINGYLIYYIREIRDPRTITDKELYTRALMKLRIEKEREEKHKFLGDLLRRASFKIIVDDDNISDMIEQIKREFE